jgi:hypothetical protein
MRHKKTRRPSEAQLAAIGRIDAECRKLGATCCKRPEGISDKTWFKCYELGYIRTVGRDGFTPLVCVGSHGTGWLSSAPKAAIVRVPAKFYIDHDDRGCEPFCEPFKRSSRFVWLLSNDPGLDELLDDARHYADPDNFGSEYGDLRRSAAATVKAIEAAKVSK